MQDTRLLMISRDDILDVMKSNKGDKVFRLLASLTRQGYHLLATAPQPDKWAGDHGSPDDALLGPNSIRKRLSDAGGQLDGVYYVRRSMLTQKRNREDALKDILERYATKPGDSVLLSTHRTFLKAAKQLGIQTIHLGHGQDLIKELTALGKRARPAEGKN
jgi:hypothetical protein